MNVKLNTLILVMCLLVVSGCGLLGNKGVPKEQINDDIASKSVKVKDGTDWYFKGDSQRCFAVIDDESKITASNADISVAVSSWGKKGKPDSKNTSCIERCSAR